MAEDSDEPIVSPSWASDTQGIKERVYVGAMLIGVTNRYSGNVSRCSIVEL